MYSDSGARCVHIFRTRVATVAMDAQRPRCPPDTPTSRRGARRRTDGECLYTHVHVTHVRVSAETRDRVPADTLPYISLIYTTGTHDGAQPVQRWLEVGQSPCPICRGCHLTRILEIQKVSLFRNRSRCLDTAQLLELACCHAYCVCTLSRRAAYAL